ncbi:hypothetical protein HCC61_20980 [Streptomyces sp. HNM0575]|uniref:hypothetical protein n=1 Tax=Streptomyces sp. HNM0575 TaxID=2716338 RepID=UPI00145F082D|nr:hypothetical protein [Streptomyces sp. HNM0575]NLU75118.1 hypothetical protein [Streptomyces sp. HNM0575]
MDMTPNPPAELAEPPSAPAATAHPVHHVPVLPEAPLPEHKGCLYAISQPPLMFFLAFIALLLAITGAHDLLFN